MVCPVCGSGRSRSLATARRSFLRCSDCGFAWADPSSRPDPAAAAARYALHRNDEGDRGYVDYLQVIIDRALRAAGPSVRTVLDWGSGPNPVCASLLRERGLDVSIWDPAFAAENPPPAAAFDLVLCIEVAEHFAEPAPDFLALASRLKPGGYAVLRTGIAPVDDEEFLGWWYVEDPTHVSFYSEESLRILGRVASLAVVGIEDGKLAVFRRPLPVLVAGGANLDVEGRPHLPLVAADSNPGTVRFSPGGTGRNIAEDLARFGLAVELVTAVGDDSAGALLAERTSAAGVGTAAFERFEGEASSSYLAVLDAAGDMAVAVNGMGLYDRFDGERALAAADRAVSAAASASFGFASSPFSALVLDGNLLPETAESLMDRFPDLPVWFDPVSTAKARRFAAYRGGALLPRLAAAKPNLMEAEALVEAASGRGGADGPSRTGAEPSSAETTIRAASVAVALRSAGIDTVYVSLGDAGVYGLSRSGSFTVAPPPAELVSATGAGDAFLAGALRAALLGLDEADRGAFGCAAAIEALGSAEACPAGMDATAMEYMASALKRSGAIAWKDVEA